MDFKTLAGRDPHPQPRDRNVRARRPRARPRRPPLPGDVRRRRRRIRRRRARRRGQRFRARHTGRLPRGRGRRDSDGPGAFARPDPSRAERVPRAVCAGPDGGKGGRVPPQHAGARRQGPAWSSSSDGRDPLADAGVDRRERPQPLPEGARPRDGQARRRRGRDHDGGARPARGLGARGLRGAEGWRAAASRARRRRSSRSGRAGRSPGTSAARSRGRPPPLPFRVPWRRFASSGIRPPAPRSPFPSRARDRSGSPGCWRG